MAASVTKVLATGAVLFAGLLAGVTLNRALVQLPAWQRIGVLAWADFSRAENAGIGAILYPALGLAALLSTIGTALVYKLGRTKRFTTSIPIYTAAGVAITWALVTRARRLACAVIRASAHAVPRVVWLSITSRSLRPLPPWT
jgi:hypothetical protein